MKPLFDAKRLKFTQEIKGMEQVIVCIWMGDGYVSVGRNNWRRDSQCYLTLFFNNINIIENNLKT